MMGTFDPVPACFCGVQYLPEPRLERIVTERLGKFERITGRRPEPPIDVDETVEIVESIRVVLIEQSHHFDDDVLGAYDFAEDRLYMRQDCGSEERRRFTLAHEYGHFVLHRPHYLQQVFDFYADSIGGAVQLHRQAVNKRNQLEVQANMFASHFLMPSGMLNEFVLELGQRDLPDLVRGVATHFQVSLQAAEIRVKKLKFFGANGGLVRESD